VVTKGIAAAGVAAVATVAVLALAVGVEPDPPTPAKQPAAAGAPSAKPRTYNTSETTNDRGDILDPKLLIWVQRGEVISAEGADGWYRSNIVPERRFRIKPWKDGMNRRAYEVLTEAAREGAADGWAKGNAVVPIIGGALGALFGIAAGAVTNRNPFGGGP
jgi:hypothetical protein